MYLRKLGFNCNACGSFAKSKERIQKFRETEYYDTFIKMKYINLAYNMT